MIVSMWQTGEGFYNDFRRWATDHFQRLGHTVIPLPAQGSVDRLGDLIFSMNFSPELARLARDLRKPYVCWVWDALVNYSLLNPAWASDYTIMFQFARSDAERFKAAGYRNVFYLPASTDEKTLLPSAGNGAASAGGIAWIGNCYSLSASPYASYKAACLKQGLSPACGLEAMDNFLEEVVRRPAHDLRLFFLDYVTARMPRFFETAPVPDRSYLAGGIDRALDFFVNYLLYHEVDIRMRSRLVQTLAPLGLDLWGEAPGWTPHLVPGVRFHGTCAFGPDLGSRLASARVCLNMSRTLSDGVNMRSFEIPACGAFQLALHSDDMAALYEDGREIVLFKTYEEARDKAAYYLEHDHERRQIAAAGRARFLRDHTLERRFESLASTLRRLGLGL
ncbi:MAG TPA: hypothetical protein DCZ95_06885 [Verrucomicrobia bacterium]|nr:MAG: hypothetical protein A2X46_06110 [Lentisphaerae bacterium GWF2_57_35]HBA83800.1 hypothetical protein [Verrucomicrobiota bacterium]